MNNNLSKWLKHLCSFGTGVLILIGIIYYGSLEGIGRLERINVTYLLGTLMCTITPALCIMFIFCFRILLSFGYIPLVLKVALKSVYSGTAPVQQVLNLRLFLKAYLLSLTKFVLIITRVICFCLTIELAIPSKAIVLGTPLAQLGYLV